MTGKRCTAIILAAGSGKRMNSNTPKQFLLLGGKPLLWYSLHAVEQSEIIDDCILVTGAEDIEYVREEIVQKYGFHKVDHVIAGGRERYESVYHALCRIVEGDMSVPNGDGYIFVHDGARPFLSEEILADTYREVCEHHACVAAVLAKDTIKIADKDGFAVRTPERKYVWTVQTPQVFDAQLIIEAYQKLFRQPEAFRQGITDDAMVVESMLEFPVKLVKSSYQNIKVTTPEDMRIAEAFL
ncbi:MAG: 2-C-methyl-D-erythritol 4-phosphate cytidylyltransferase [Lachnospiraceae bacterium]|nr:2-C-methyl-D-erythritol 4-phosphate cytidylyltransferase [Lachnospiraceae bacterium]